jgi:RNA polymerase sigma-70 factor (ECF subfamily)
MSITTRMPGRKANSVEETELLEALLHGSEAERRSRRKELVERYERLIISCIRNVLRRYGAEHSRADLEDLVNDVWVVLLRDDLRKLRQYRAERGLRLASFIGLVATNLTIDHLRGRRAEAAPLELIDVAGPVELPRDSLEDHQQSELARQAMTRLSSDERAFVVEVFQEERAPEELARELGLTVNTIYSRKVKIRQKLARIVATLENAA